MRSVGARDEYARRRAHNRRVSFTYRGASFVCHKCKCRIEPGIKVRKLPKSKKIVHQECEWAGYSRYNFPVTVTRI